MESREVAAVLKTLVEYILKPENSRSIDFGEEEEDAFFSRHHENP